MSKYIDLIKNVGLFTISNIAVKLITFLLVPLYTYYLTTEEFGVTDMLTNSVTLIMPVATFSIADAVLRFCIEDKNNVRGYMSAGIIVCFISCLIVVISLPLTDLSFFGGLGGYKPWVLLVYSLMTFHNLFSNVSRGLNQVNTMVIASVISSIANILSAVVFIAFLEKGVIGYFLSLTVGNSVAILYYLLWGKQYKYIKFRSLDKKKIKDMFRYSLPLVPNGLFWMTSQTISRFILTGYFGIGASGLFAAASKIPGILNLVSGIFQQAWNLSAFQEFKAKGREYFFEIIYKLYDCGMTTCTAILILLSQPMASIFFKNDFYSAWKFVPFLMLSIHYSSLSAFFGSIYTASMKTKYLFTSTIYGAVLSVGLAFLLIPKMGILGACIAAALSNFVVYLLRMINTRKMVSIKQSIPVLIEKNILLVFNAIVVTSGSDYYLIASIALSSILVGISVNGVFPIILPFVHKLSRKES